MQDGKSISAERDAWWMWWLNSEECYFCKDLSEASVEKKPNDDRWPSKDVRLALRGNSDKAKETRCKRQLKREKRVADRPDRRTR